MGGGVAAILLVAWSGVSCFEGFMKHRLCMFVLYQFAQFCSLVCYIMTREKILWSILWLSSLLG